MAVAPSEGFSIREYTARIRVVDVEKCWPFSLGGDADGGNVQAEATLLPPITVKKFLWWSHELNKINQQAQDQDHDFVGISRNKAKEREEEEEKSEITCPVCGNFTAKNKKAANAHFDSCLADAQRDERKKMKIQFKSKSKSKWPKKRSILEIFAVSPQVDRVDDDEEDEDQFVNGQEREEVEKTKNKKIKMTNINKKIKKVAIRNKLTIDKKRNRLKMKKKHKNKLMMKNHKGSIANKGNAQKLILPIPVNFSKKVNGSSFNKVITDANLDDGSSRRNKSGLKGFEQKQHGTQASKFTAKHQKLLVPVHGILKNHKKHSQEKNSEIRNTSSGSQANRCEFQYPDRHVRFSGKDDILGPGGKSFNSSEKNVFASYPEFLSSESEQDHLTESDKESDAVGVEEGADISARTGNGTGFRANNNNKQLPGINVPVSMPDFPSQYGEEGQCILDKSSSNPFSICGDSLHMFAQGYPTTLNKSTHAGILRLLPPVNEAHNAHVNSQLHSNVSMASSSRGKSIDYYEDCTYGFSAIDSLANTRAFRQPPSPTFPLMESTSRSLLFMPQSSIQSVTGQALQNQPRCYLSPMGFTGQDDWRQAVDASGTRGVGGEFCGLPLNSHGELIHVGSSGGVGLEQLKKSTTLASSSSSCMPGNFTEFVSEKNHDKQAVPKGQLNFLPVQKKHNTYLPARFGVSELPNTDRLDFHFSTSERENSNKVYQLDSNLNSTNISLSQCKQHLQNRNGNGTQNGHMKNSDSMFLKTVQPTMRLMGKDVAVGRSNSEMQGLDDGNIWMDKEIIQEHSHSLNGPGNSLPKRQLQQERLLFPALEKSKEDLHLPLEFENSRASQSNFLAKSQEARASHLCFNWKTGSSFQYGNPTANLNPSSHLHPCAHSSSLDLFSKRACLEDGLASSAENAGIGSQVLPIMPASMNIHPCIGWRPADLNYQQNLPNARRSAFDFPFLHPDCDEHIQSSSFLSSSKSLPPWLVHATVQVKPTTMPTQNFSDVRGKHHPCTTSGAHLLTPFHYPSMVSYPNSSVISNPSLRSSLESALFVRPPVYPLDTGVHPNSSMNRSYRNKIINDNRMKLNAFGVNIPDDCQKNKKRAAAIVESSFRPSKMPSLMLEDSSAAAGLGRETFSGEIWHNMATYEARSKDSKGTDLGCGSYEGQNTGLGTSHEIDFSKADTLVKSGPIKLAAGTKHILKPGRNVDHDNSRLIHSTIPYPGATDCDSFLDSQKKSTMIYRF